MQKLTSTVPRTRSSDLVAENIARLKALFPAAFTDGAIHFGVLRQLLGDSVDDCEEKFGLNWHGKRRARQLALTPSTGTLRPCPGDSVNWDSTQNIFIEGDNLEVLKLLQKSYAGTIKLIYIDPPYNTNDDRIYSDSFEDNIRNYLKISGQSDGAGGKFITNTESSGRFHTNWLNMLYPRLKLARNLLSDTGVMVVHMDEHETSHLEEIVHEIFGEENMLGIAVWDKKNPKGDSTTLAYQHESLLFVAKNREAVAESGGLTRRKKNAEAILAKAEQLFARIGKQELPADLKQCAARYELSADEIRRHVRKIDLETVNAEFAEWMRKQDFSGGEMMYCKLDEAGNVYRLVSMAWPNKKKAPDDYFIPLQHPVTKKDCPVPERGWRNPPDTMRRLLAAGEIVFGPEHTTQPQRKYLLKNNMTENFPSVLSYGGSDDGLLAELGIPFDNPKPVNVAMEIIASVTGSDDTVLDFFAGSGTTGHAVFELNRQDAGRRRVMLVQFPEPLDPDSSGQKIGAKFCDQNKKPRTIAEITKERLRRAGKKIKDETPMFSGDVGFRVLKLDASNLREWDPRPADLRDALLAHAEHILPGRTEQDILYELLLKLGLDLCVPIETKELSGKPVYSIGGGALFVCLADTLTSESVEALALGLIAWRDALAPAVKSNFVFKDSAFGDDLAKLNLTAILEQNLKDAGLGSVRSL